MSHFDDNKEWIAGQHILHNMDSAYSPAETKRATGCSPEEDRAKVRQYKYVLDKISVMEEQYKGADYASNKSRLRYDLDRLYTMRDQLRRELNIKAPGDLAKLFTETAKEDMATMEENGKAAITALAQSVFGKKGTKPMATAKTKLYEIRLFDPERTVYGTKLTTNSRGQWVMELKGDGGVIAVDPKFVTEVMPYTVAVAMQGGNIVQLLAEANKFAVGEFYLTAAMTICKVIEVDTKSRQTTTKFRPVAKLAAEAMLWPADEEDEDNDL